MTGAITSLPCHHHLLWLAAVDPCTLILASPGHSSEVLAPASLTQAVRTRFLRKPPERCRLYQASRMMVVAVETAGLDPGTAASFLYPGPAPLTQFAAGEHRTWETNSGGIGLSLSQPAPVSPDLGPGGLALSPPACDVHTVLSCTGLTGTGDNMQDLGHRLEGQVQSSHHSPLAQPYILRPSHLQERLLHQHQDFIHPVHHHSPSYACGRWDTATSHTGSPVSTAKPSHSPGRCQAEAPTHSRLSRAPIMGSSAR